MNIKITSYPRIHISLLDLSQNGYRLFGGIGFCIEAMPMEIGVAPAKNLDLSELKSSGYSDKDVLRISNTLIAVGLSHGFKNSIHLCSFKGPTRHSGLGTGTQLLLALVEALFISNESQDRCTIINASGRGGASGVGIQTYFDGGLVFDIGRSRGKLPAVFLPSNASRSGQELPLKVGQLSQVPWPCGIFIPHDIPVVETDREMKFFKEFTPAPDCDVYRVVYEAIFGVFGGAVSNDFSSFSSAINQIQLLHWKRNEIKLHGDAVLNYMLEIGHMGACAVGMSSFGPCLYYFGTNSEEIAQNLSQKYPNAISISAPIRSSGRVINVS